MKRLYVVVRGDLDAGLQQAQSVHVAVEFAVSHPELRAQWQRDSNNVVCVAVPSLEALQRLAVAAERAGAACSKFHEPDLGDELTAIAGDLPPALVASLPLSLRGYRPSLAA